MPSLANLHQHAAVLTAATPYLANEAAKESAAVSYPGVPGLIVEPRHATPGAARSLLCRSCMRWRRQQTLLWCCLHTSCWKVSGVPGTVPQQLQPSGPEETDTPFRAVVPPLAASHWGSGRPAPRC